MLKTGIMTAGQIVEGTSAPVDETDSCTPGGIWFSKWLGGGLIAGVFMFSAIAPVSVDMATGEIYTSAALAGQGDGNYGNGNGNGGPNGQIPGNSDHDDDDDYDDDEGDDDDDGDADDGDNQAEEGPPAIPVTEESGGQDDSADAASGMAEIDFAETLDTVAGVPVDGPPEVTLPTIGQIFAMGDESALSTEAELEIIASGWNAPK